jgi:hypothetical protein
MKRSGHSLSVDCAAQIRIGETRRAVLHLGDLGVRIGLACPVIVRELLALALAVEPYEIVDRRGVSTPLSLAIRVSISRLVSPLSRRLIAIAAPLEAMDQALAS